MNQNSTESLRSRQKQQRRESILAAARALVTEIGYDAVTLEMVADRAELTKPTLYAYFENRDDLLLAAYLKVLEHSKATRAGLEEIPSPRARLSIIVRRVLEANFADSESMYAWPPNPIARHPLFVIELQAIRDELESLVRQGQALGEIASDLDPAVAIQSYFSIAGNYLTLRRLIDGGIVEAPALIEQLHRFILHSLQPPHNQGTL